MQTASNSIKRDQRSLRYGRAVLLLLLAAPASVVSLGAGLHVLHGTLTIAAAPDTGPADLLTGLVAGLALALTAWLLLGVALASLAEALPAGRAQLPRRLSPLLARRIVAALLGLGLAATTGAAQASPRSPAVAAAPMAWSADDTPEPGFTPPPAPPAPAPSWTPAAPAVRPVTGPGPLAATPRDRDDATVVVRRGDTLWGIVERHLGPAASTARIAADWPRWYAANRSVIGPDPDRILPGQVLVVPGGGPR